MSEAELRAVPAGGNQYMLDARRVGNLQDVVTIDGTPRGRGGNIAGYANYACATVANAAPHDEAHRPPSRHTGETYVVIRTTERVLAGTEIRWDYDMGEQTRTYLDGVYRPHFWAFGPPRRLCSGFRGCRGRQRAPQTTPSEICMETNGLHAQFHARAPSPSRNQGGSTEPVRRARSWSTSRQVRW